MLLRTSHRWLAWVLLCATMLAACTDLRASSVESVTINEVGATVAVGDTIVLTVTVVAEGGADESVAWSSSDESLASVSPSGRVLGVTPGEAVITATSVFDASKHGSVLVSVVPASVAPASIAVLEGNDQAATVGSAVLVRPSVVVRDQDGVPVPGVSVSFDVTAGGGAITGSPVTTDSQGISRISAWLLGPVTGTNTVRATVAGSTPSISVGFSATGIPGAASPTTSLLTAEPPSLPNDDTATSLLTLTLKDDFGNATTAGGAAVDFDPPDHGSVGPVTDEGAGTYSAVYTAGTTAGPADITLRLGDDVFVTTRIVVRAVVGEWEEVDTYLDYRKVGAAIWNAATGYARVQHMDMGRATHTVALDSLEPGTEYEIRFPYDPLVVYPTVIDDPTRNMTIHWQTHVPLFADQQRPTNDDWVFRFRTFPAQLSDDPVRIGFGGDIKQGRQPYEMYEEVFRAYTSEDLHALVITGDWAYDDNLPFNEPYWGDNRFADLWDVYKLHGQDTQGRLTPILPGIGNHEVAGGYRGSQYDWTSQTLGDNTVFAVQFPAVPSEWFFTTDIGDYASIVMLDSEHVNPRIGSNSDVQTAWLADALEDRKHVPNVFVTYHVAAYPVNRGFNDAIPLRIRNAWHPLLDRHDNIKLVFEMHDHLYGESHWIRGGEIANDGEGIKYLGAGHMGTSQDRLFWNPATTWYLKDAYGLQAKRAQSDEPHEDDGVFFDLTGDFTRHIWIVELTADERRVRSHMINGTSRANFAY